MIWCGPSLRAQELPMKLFRPRNFFKLFEQFQKLVAFLLPIFRNVDGSWRVTSKLRGSTLIQVARRRSKVFQRFSASLVRVGDVQGVSRRHAVRGKKYPLYGDILGNEWMNEWILALFCLFYYILLLNFPLQLYSPDLSKHSRE